MLPFLIFLGVIIIIGVLGGAWFVAKDKKKKKILDSLQLKLLLVRFPMGEKEGRDLNKEIGFSEQFFSALVSFKEPVIFEVAVPYAGEEISFYVSVPSRFVQAVTRQIHSIWNEAQVDQVDDYNIFYHSGAVSGAWVSQKKSYVLPIRTYHEVESDTFSPIIGGLSKVDEIGEGGAVQIVVRSASQNTKNKISSALKSLKKGKAFDDVFKEKSPFSLSLSDFSDALTKGSAGEGHSEEKSLDDVAIKALEMKISKPLFEVNVRVIASGPTQELSDTLLDGMIAGFSQFSAPERNECEVKKEANSRSLIHEFSFRLFNEKNKMVLNSEELASIFHFPNPFLEIPRVKHLKFKEAPPPSDLPNQGIIVGESSYRGVLRKVRIQKEDRRRHLYIIGQTGTGKSVSLNNLASQDIVFGDGLCVMDPNGDLFEDILKKVSKERVKDVVLLDPSDLERPVGINMLEYDPRFPEQKTFIINELMTIFDTLYDLKNTGGPMFEQYTRNALLLLMDDPEDRFTILEIPKVLADSDFRKKLLTKCRNTIAKDFWEKEAEKAGGDASLQNLVPYITSKFNVFIANDYIRPILAQSRSSINFRSIIDEGKILLVNLSKGRIGEINASLLGMIIVGKLTMSAFSRADVPMDQRKDFYLYIDEFQNFTTPSISTILSEARKYRLNLIIAHQFIAQLSDKIKDAVFGNVGSMIAFRVGADDAEYLSKQFAPVFNESNLLNIDNLNAHAKLTINGKVSTPFNIKMNFPEKGNQEVAQLAREYSRLTYGRSRDDVEEEIRGRLKSETVI